MGEEKKISIREVEHIAELARIELDEKEKEKFTKELSDILGYVRQLQEVDTDKVKPVSQATNLINIVREDVALDAKEETRRDIMDNFPDREGDYIKVKQVL